MKHRKDLNLAFTIVVAFVLELVYFNSSISEETGPDSLFSLWYPSLIAVVTLIAYLLMRWIKRPLAWIVTLLGLVAQGILLWIMFMD